MNILLLSGVALSLAFAGYLKTLPEAEMLALIVFGLAAIQLVGLSLIARGVTRGGALTILWTGLLTLPRGTLSALGARRTLDEMTAQRFEDRRVIA